MVRVFSNLSEQAGCMSACFCVCGREREREKERERDGDIKKGNQDALTVL